MGRFFDGVDDELNFGNLTFLNGAAALTIMADITPLNQGGNAGYLGRHDGSNGFMWYQSGAGLLTFHFAGGPTQGEASGVMVNRNRINVAMVYDGPGAANAQRLQMYVDGVRQVLSFSGTIPAVLASITSPYYLGRRPDTGIWTPQIVSGHKLWLAALSEAEVHREMGSARPQRTELLRLWSPLDDDPIRDLSGSGLHPSVVGTTIVEGAPTSWGG